MSALVREKSIPRLFAFPASELTLIFKSGIIAGSRLLRGGSTDFCDFLQLRHKLPLPSMDRSSFRKKDMFLLQPHDTHFLFTGLFLYLIDRLLTQQESHVKLFYFKD